ncbi:MAG: hypothetical protein WD851_22000 [Pirellulales bacterium]
MNRLPSRIGKLIVLWFIGIPSAATATGQSLLPAFPGAEGAGAFARGGRGGDVYHVTNLNDSGPGSLRSGFQTAPTTGRTIVFSVGGTIELQSTLRLRRPNVTVAGQTAPGQGILIKNFDTQIENTTDVVFQHLRFRPGLDRAGTTSGSFRGDALELNNVTDIMIDHCSMSWSIDEAFGSSGRNSRITVQWSTFTEALHDTGFHPYGPDQKHSDGALLAVDGMDGYITVHHSLFAHNNLRSPRVRSYDFYVHTADLRNNVTYNWGDAAAYAGGSTEDYDDYAQINFVGNYSIAGRSTDGGSRLYALEDWGRGINPAIGKTWDLALYQDGNKIDFDRDRILDGTDTGWNMFTGPYVPKDVPFALPGLAVTTDPVDVAYERVLAEAGAISWSRDTVDERIVQEVMTQMGRIINSPAEVGGHPTLPTEYWPSTWDTDLDGMPNYWEVLKGTNPNAADNNGDLNRNGYTNLEEYLHYAARPVAIPEPGTWLLLVVGCAGFRWLKTNPPSTVGPKTA